MQRSELGDSSLTEESFIPFADGNSKLTLILNKDTAFSEGKLYISIGKRFSTHIA